MRTVRIATRASRLALVQARMAADRIAACGRAVELVPVSTLGDRVTDRSLAAIGGDGVFVKELEARLLDGDADVAVHSLKDLPTQTDPRLCDAAVLERDDPRDVLASRQNRYPSLSSLPQAGVVGTSSLRRRAMLLAARPDVDVRDLRGNVETRLRKMEEGAFDAVILAMAGLRRADLLERVGGGAPIPIEEMVPAPGQGAICMQCRADDDEMREMLGAIDHGPTAIAVTMERAVLRRMGGGCLVPIGAHAVLDGADYTLHAAVAATDGSACVRKTARGRAEGAVAAAAAGERLADEMLAAGGRELVDRFRETIAKER